MLQTLSGGRDLRNSVVSGNVRRNSALLPSTSSVREVTLMRAVLIVLAVVAVLAAISFVGFFGIVTPIATAAVLLVPATFMVSLVIGFASRRRSWFG